MYTLSMYRKGINIIEGYFTKSELLYPKKEKSPTCFDFEIFFPDPQLHQTFKPIRELLCIFSTCNLLNLYMIYVPLRYKHN